MSPFLWNSSKFQTQLCDIFLEHYLLQGSNHWRCWYCMCHPFYVRSVSSQRIRVIWSSNPAMEAIPSVCAALNCRFYFLWLFFRRCALRTAGWSSHRWSYTASKFLTRDRCRNHHSWLSRFHTDWVPEKCTVRNPIIACYYPSIAPNSYQERLSDVPDRYSQNWCSLHFFCTPESFYSEHQPVASRSNGHFPWRPPRKNQQHRRLFKSYTRKWAFFCYFSSHAVAVQPSTACNYTTFEHCIPSKWSQPWPANTAFPIHNCEPCFPPPGKPDSSLPLDIIWYLQQNRSLLL